jgi:hypothetical protein
MNTKLVVVSLLAYNKSTGATSNQILMFAWPRPDEEFAPIDLTDYAEHLALEYYPTQKGWSQRKAYVHVVDEYLLDYVHARK